ncbi:MAG TPA: N-6 DNA methylase [Armatimonadota bacterium]|jgi:hypothetical protein
MRTARSSSRNHDWLSLVGASGLLISPPVLEDAFPEGPELLDYRTRSQFELAGDRFAVGLEQHRPDAQTRWLDFILEKVLETQDHWLRGSNVPESCTHELLDYQQVLRPDRVLVNEAGEPQLLLTVVPLDQALDARETRTGSWRASPAVKMERLLRETGQRFGLITNGHDFRLLSAPPGLGSASLTWHDQDWLDEPATLDGFFTLLRTDRFLGPERTRLLKLADQSQDKQLEVTDQLGDQVHQALEVFLRALDQCDQEHEGALLREMTPAELYEMCLFVMMRLVFLLYAEEKYLLPHGEVLYDQGYGVTHLWTELDRQRKYDPESLVHMQDAFPRLLATFRLIHEGCTHPDLNLVAYGGRLFDPARFPVLEDPRLRLSNHLVGSVLHKLLFAKARVGGQTGLHRLAYSQIDVEQIGTVYEGLLGYTVKRCPAEETRVVFRGSDETMRPLEELEAQAAGRLPEYLRRQTGWTENQVARALEQSSAPDDEDLPPGVDDALRQRLLPFTSFLRLEDTIPGGHLYVASDSGLRKAQGVYYTPKWITSFIVERTLEPLVYDGEGEARRVKPPRELLALKVCDPAMGSGAFLVQACRYLGERLAESWDLAATASPEQVLTLPYALPLAENPLGQPFPEDHAEAVAWARRFVAEHCLYGVDLNPLAVELAKLSLWLVTLSQDQPFEFLDHKLKAGNSLIGCRAAEFTTYPVAAWGRKDPDAEVNALLRETLRTAKSEARRQEQDRKRGVYSLFEQEVAAKRAETAREMELIDAAALPGEKERLYRDLIENDAEWQGLKRCFDAWCALWFWPLGTCRAGATSPAAPPPSGAGVSPVSAPLPRDWPDLLAHLRGQEALTLASADQLQTWGEQAQTIHDRERFFHWELEFPEVFADDRGGFDAVVGNPPWDHIEFDDIVFFLGKRPDIVAAPTMAARNRLIARLVSEDPVLLDQRNAGMRRTHNVQDFIRGSGHFPRTDVGRINLYQVFAGTFDALRADDGMAGMVVPTGIATDFYTREFFAHLMQRDLLRALYDFENREGIFRDVHRSFKFSLFFIGRGGTPPDFAFFLGLPEHLKDDWRHFTLTAEDISLLNPNTRTCPIFRSQRDAEITKSIYRRHPVLVREVHDERGTQIGEENPWSLQPMLMFMMNSASHLFRTQEQLETQGYGLQGNRFWRSGEVYLPLYEGKMIHQYDDRFASVTGSVATDASIGAGLDTTLAQHLDPHFSVLPRYWVAAEEVAAKVPNTWERQWFLGLRDVARATDERTCIASVLPYSAVGNKVPLLLIDQTRPQLAACLQASLSSFGLDYVVRQKLGGITMNFFYVEQFSVVPPSGYAHDDVAFISSRVLELTYTAWDIQAFAQDLGYEGPPFVWEEERRAHLRAQLDALYFHLYGLDRDDTAYILDTFPIVRRKDEKRYNEYRTKRLILQYYDDQANGNMDTWHGPEELRAAKVHESP